MENHSGNTLHSVGTGGEDRKFIELKNRYPHIYFWYKNLFINQLSQKGYENYAARFKLSPEEFRHIIDAFRKGGNHA